MTHRELATGRNALVMEPDWLTLGQAAKYLGVAQSTIRKWSDLGRVPAFYTPGGHRRFRRGDLDTFLERSGPAARMRSGPRVLVVDDDPSVREYVRASLELEGYTVLEAGGADEGMDAIEAEPPDLILVDVMMPDVDGWELLRRIHERHGAGTIPVLMFSGVISAEGEAQSRGAQGFMRKPFDPDELVAHAKQMVPV
jgi:excisionase family DNA binding protein